MDCSQFINLFKRYRAAKELYQIDESIADPSEFKTQFKQNQLRAAFLEKCAPESKDGFGLGLESLNDLCQSIFKKPFSEMIGIEVETIKSEGSEADRIQGYIKTALNAELTYDRLAGILIAAIQSEKSEVNHILGYIHPYSL